MNQKSRLVKQGTEPMRKVEPPKRTESPRELEARLRREWMKPREEAKRTDPKAEFKRLFKD